MSDNRYDKLEKKYNALLEENEYLRAKIRKLESKQDSIIPIQKPALSQKSLFQEAEGQILDQKYDAASTCNVSSGGKSIIFLKLF